MYKQIKEAKFDLKIYNTETSEVITPFHKKPASDIAPIKSTFYNTTTTKKQKNVEFYNYIQYLEKFGFVWEYSALDLNILLNFLRIKKINKKKDNGKEH